MENQNASVKSGKKTLREFFENTGVVYLMLAPNFILFLLFSIYPILWTLRFMFYEYDGITVGAFVGFENFIRVFTRDPQWWNSVVITFEIAALKLLIEIPLCLILGVLLNQQLRGRSFFRGVYFLPTITSAAVMSLVFSFIFSPYNGIINSMLKSAGLISENINFLEKPFLALMTCVMIAVWQAFGQNVLLVLSALQNVSPDIYESAAIDGANTFAKFTKITVPLIMPVMRIIFMLAMIGSLQIFDTIYVLTGGGPGNSTDVMAINIYKCFFTADTLPNYGYGATLGFISSIIIGIITLVYLFISKKSSEIYD